MNKFIVKRTDGTELPETAKFFVLRIDFHGHTEETIAARQALATYCELTRNTELYREITGEYMPPRIGTPR